MNALQLFMFIMAGFPLISWISGELVGGREYLPAALPVTQRKLLLYPSYYKPSYNQYQQTYYPQYTSAYHPHYNHGIIGGYQQQVLGQQIPVGNLLGLLGLGLGGYHPNVNVDLLNALKPRADVSDTIYDAANGGYIYGKKK